MVAQLQLDMFAENHISNESTSCQMAQEILNTQHSARLIRFDTKVKHLYRII